MRVALINGSPKGKKSISHRLLEHVSALLPETAVLEAYDFSTATVDPARHESLVEADVLLFAFPLYVDGIPGHLLTQLEALGPLLKNKEKPARVHGLVNCGFFEGAHNRPALEMLGHFSRRSGSRFGVSVGVGAGPMVGQMTPGKGPAKRLKPALETLVEAMISGAAGELVIVDPVFPRFLYRIAGNRQWVQVAKKRGLTKDDLGRRLP